MTSKTNSDHFVSKKANQATVNAGSDDVKYVTSQKLQSKLVDEFWEDWNNASYGTGWGTGSRALQYRKGIENSVQITGVLSSSGASNIITTLPAGYRPTSTVVGIGFDEVAGASSPVRIDFAGNVKADFVAHTAFAFMFTFTLD